jgi:hypothetical protein
MVGDINQQRQWSTQYVSGKPSGHTFTSRLKQSVQELLKQIKNK